MRIEYNSDMDIDIQFGSKNHVQKSVTDILVKQF